MLYFVNIVLKHIEISRYDYMLPDPYLALILLNSPLFSLPFEGAKIGLS